MCIRGNDIETPLTKEETCFWRFPLCNAGSCHSVMVQVGIWDTGLYMPTGLSHAESPRYWYRIDVFMFKPSSQLHRSCSTCADACSFIISWKTGPSELLSMEAMSCSLSQRSQQQRFKSCPSHVSEEITPQPECILKLRLHWSFQARYILYKIITQSCV